MKDVGDGLNLLIINDEIYNLTIDFGGKKNLTPDWCFHENFLLSHHHADHYNGILQCLETGTGCWHLHNFYYPIMPSFPESEAFFAALFTMNIYLNPNHPIQTSVFSAVSALSKTKVKPIPVSQGDKICIGSNVYEILWPPKVLTEKDTVKATMEAVTSFKDALNEDSELQGIYSRITKKNLETFWGTNEENIDDLRKRILIKKGQKKEVSNIKIAKANKALRNAANELSIAFKRSDNILFLGDLDEKQLSKVAKDIIRSGCTHFRVIIAAHHGTHFHQDQLCISSDTTLASVGSLKTKIKPCYSKRASLFLTTHDHRNIYYI